MERMIDDLLDLCARRATLRRHRHATSSWRWSVIERAVSSGDRSRVPEETWSYSSSTSCASSVIANPIGNALKYAALGP
jgi:hypothetical protein